MESRRDSVEAVNQALGLDGTEIRAELDGVQLNRFRSGGARRSLNGPGRDRLPGPDQPLAGRMARSGGTPGEASRGAPAVSPGFMNLTSTR